MKISYDEYKGMVLRILQFENEKKRKPNFVTLKGIKITKKQYEDMISRVDDFIRNKKRAPKAVEVKDEIIKAPSPKPKVITDLEIALGGKFNNLTQFYQLIKKNVYLHYKNDKYDFKSERNRLSRHLGLNCADFAQVGMHAADGFNQMGINYKARYVHVRCRDKYGKPNPDLGHYFLQVIGGEFKTWTIYDLAEAASGKKPIGTTMCMRGFKVLDYNDKRLKVDDGR